MDSADATPAPQDHPSAASPLGDYLGRNPASLPTDGAATPPSSAASPASAATPEARSLASELGDPARRFTTDLRGALSIAWAVGSDTLVPKGTIRPPAPAPRKPAARPAPSLSKPAPAREREREREEPKPKRAQRNILLFIAAATGIYMVVSGLVEAFA